MSQPTTSASPPSSACRVLEARVDFRSQHLLTPLVLSTGTIESLIEAAVEVTVEIASGGRATGKGSIYLSDLWAWPTPALTHQAKQRQLCQVVQQIAAALPDLNEQRWLHPLELGLRLHHWVCHEIPASRSTPALALAMCGSPFDAAIHDAAGLATARSALALYDEPATIPSADAYFPEGGAVAAIRDVIGPLKAEIPAWFIVNKTDSLPEALASAFQRGGYRCFKLKIPGTDAQADAARTRDVFRAARAVGIASPVLSVDSNEANPDAESVLDYLHRLHAIDEEAYAALRYLEQPTGRDIRRHAFDWRPVAAKKPVLLDEGLTDLAMLADAKAQGWSGLALKTCKGHSMLLAAAAWAQRKGLVVSLQDLTNPGVSLIHAALVGGCLPTINGAELNSPQFTPAANAEFLPRLSGLFVPQGGAHRLPARLPAGLGSIL